AVPTVAADTVEGHLRKFVPPLFARWERTAWRAIGVYGPGSPAIVRDAMGPDLEPDGSEDAVTPIPLDGTAAFAIGTAEAGGARGFDIFVADDAFADSWARLLDVARRHAGGEIDMN